MARSLAGSAIAWLCAVGLAIAAAMLEGSQPRVAVGLFVSAFAVAGVVTLLLVLLGARDRTARQEPSSPLARLDHFAGAPDDWAVTSPRWSVIQLPGRSTAAAVERVTLVGRRQVPLLPLSRRLKDAGAAEKRRLA
jgi:hypothetical protein